MVNELIVPAALAGPDIQRQEAAGEQVGAGPVATVVVAGRVFHWQIDDAQLRITGDRRPDTRVAGVLITAIEPRLGTEFIRLGNGMEGPEQFAGVYIEAPYITLDVGFGAWTATGGVRRPDNDDVIHHKGRCRRADVDVIEPVVLRIAQS